MIKQALVKANIQKASARMKIDDLVDKMAKALNDTWNRKARKAITETLTLVKNARYLSSQELEFIQKNLELQLGAPIGATAVEATKDYTAGAYMSGAKAVTGKTKTAFVSQDLNALSALDRHKNIFASDYYPDQLAKATRDALKPYFMGQQSTLDTAYKIRNAMGEQFLGNDEYWKTFSEQSIMQTRNLGMLSEYEAGQIEVVRVRAIIDERTSEICLRLHGQVISVRDLSRQRDNWQKAVNKGDKEGIKKAWPWIGTKQAMKLTTTAKVNAQIKKGNIGMPPYHGRCRTVTVIEYEAKAGKRVLTPTDKKKITKIKTARKKK